MADTIKAQNQSFKKGKNDDRPGADDVSQCNSKFKSRSSLNLTPSQQLCVEELRKLQDEHDRIEKQYEAAWNELKAKYLQKFKPLYAQRRDHLVFCGPDVQEQHMHLGTPNLPNFWLQCMRNNKSLSELIEDRDLPILEYLKNISFSWADDHKQDTYTLEFEFEKNPYFTPLTIRKTYLMACPAGFNEYILVSTSSTKIEWEEGKNVMVQVSQRKQRNSKTKEVRVVNKTKEMPTFFNFFSNHVLPTETQLNSLHESQIAEFELTIEADYEVGVIIREKILPQALLWFLGEAEEDYSDYEDSDETSSSSSEDESDFVYDSDSKEV